MSIQLDHLIIPSKDKYAAAQLVAELFNVPFDSNPLNYFIPVYMNENLTLDFDQHEEHFPILHYCFRVNETEFDEILDRIKAKHLAYRSSPSGEVDSQISTYQGGRIVYWNEPDGHFWEILTKSYARKA